MMASLPEDTHSWLVSEEFRIALAGRYTIERVIGRGGMGVVYRALDVRHGRPVAIKVLKPELTGGDGVQRFLSEVQVLARLQHPGIVPLHDSGVAAGLPFYVMACVEGESLRDLLAREGQLSLARAVSIATSLAEAIDFAHAHGVVHRDIKPANVIVDGEQTFILDFGLALAIGAGYADRLTASGMILGTPQYMSPEQASGGKHIDGRSDVYSLGCVVYEMLAGEPPFDGSTPQAVLAKHMIAPIPNVTVLRSTVPAAVQQTLEIALAKSPVDRFATAGEFAGALRTSMVKPRRRRVVATVALASAGALLLAVLVGRAIGSDPEERSSANEVGDPSRVAVLYFDDLTPDSSHRHVAAGLTDQLINELSRVSMLRVVPRQGVRPYADRSIPIDSVAAILGVRTVIDGTVEVLADQLRVRVQFIDASSNEYTDSLTLERPLSDIGTLEREVTQRVVAGLRRHIGRSVRVRKVTSGTRNPTSKELLLKARRARDEGQELATHPHPADLSAALEAFRRSDSLLVLAQAEDPSWRQPLLERGWVAHHQARLLHGAERMVAAEASLRFGEEATARNPGNAEALELRGTALWWLATQLEAAPTDPERIRRAEADLRAAVDGDSTLASAWATLSFLLLVKGSFAEAAMTAKRALHEDPFLENADKVFTELFFSALMLGDFAQADEWCQRGRSTLPQDWRFVECELTLLRHDASEAPDDERAWALVASLDRLDPAARASAAGRPYHPIYRRIVAATISARAGRRDLARQELARARQLTAGDTSLRLDLAYDEAYLRLVLGEREAAAALMDRLLDARPVLRPMIARDPLFKDLRLSGQPE